MSHSARRRAGCERMTIEERKMLIQDRVKSGGVVVGRVLIALLFLHEAWAKVTGLEGASAYMAKFGVPWALLPLAIIAETAGGLCLLFGYQTRHAAFALSGFCIAAAFLFHTNFANKNELLHFEKDLALAGGLLLLALSDTSDNNWSLTRRVFGRG